uniref:Uncharacterized protein n=1 Tax=Helianthus annuus TaxID=4232 RepID=A0A251UYD1_HELAN
MSWYILSDPGCTDETCELHPLQVRVNRHKVGPKYAPLHSRRRLPFVPFVALNRARLQP